MSLQEISLAIKAWLYSIWTYWIDWDLRGYFRFFQDRHATSAAEPRAGRISRQEAADCWDALWQDARQRDTFGTMCTVLRIDGWQDAGWDPFAESDEAFKDYNWYLKAESKELSAKARWRIGLLMYCQACEMSAVHTTLANLLRIILGEPYHVDPLSSLGRPDKKRMFKFYPPSATVKWRKIRDMALKAKRADLVGMIDAVYNDAVRNAFSHSDYIITNDDFRWTEGGPAGRLPLAQLNNLMSNAFDFFGVFVAVRNRTLEQFGQMRRYHRSKNFEVLELLKTGGKLDGFRIHFPTGGSARFRRGPQGVVVENMIPGAGGVLTFMIGNVANKRPRYVVDGQVVDFGGQNAVDHF